MDASVVAPLLVDDGATGDRARRRARSEDLHAPHLVDVEVTSRFRRGVRTGSISAARARAALDDLSDLRLLRYPHAALLDRVWELRDNVSAYDAAYVALAELLGASLFTADGRLARAAGLDCATELLE